MEIIKHIIIFSKDNSMDGVISKYYTMSRNTSEIIYNIYLPINKKIKFEQNPNFRIIRYKWKIPIFRYYCLFKNFNFSNINIIRYVGADFSLFFFCNRYNKIFWELHTNYISELGNVKFIGNVIKFFELSIGRFVLKNANGIVAPSNSIFDVNKKTYKYNCSHHLLLNSFISTDNFKKNNFKYNSKLLNIENKKYILIMASNFKFWHDLEMLEKIILNIDLNLIVIGNVINKSSSQNIIYYGYVENTSELETLISNSLFCIDSLGFDSLGLIETSSLKFFKYLEHGGRVITFKNPPFNDEFLMPKFVKVVNSIDDIKNILNNSLPLSYYEKYTLRQHMIKEYCLSKILNLESKYLKYESNR